MIRSGSRSIGRSSVFTPSSRIPRSTRIPQRTLSSTPLTQSPGPSNSNRSGWAAATESAHSVLTPPTTPMADPLSAIHAEIGNLKSSLFNMLGSSHPSLDTVAKYYFHAEGKHLRPLLVLLMSQATNGLAESGWQKALQETERRGVDDSLSEGGVLNDWNPEIMGVEGSTAYAAPYTISGSGSGATRTPSPPTPRIPILETNPDSPSILPTQRRLASITEMIHVASLLHDDVIDTSDQRRGSPSAPQMFGNKLSILSGDFLLGRASVALARLGSREVVELLATVIANLVEGEVMQLKATSEPEEKPTAKGFEDYMRKTYLKSASLLAKSARAAVILGGCGGESEWVKDVAYGYGRNLGMAFQLIDDTFDFLPAAEDLGKPSNGADLRLGLATAPSLFAWEQNPELGPLIRRKFNGPGDVELARELVMKSDGIERTQQLARQFAGEARALVERLPASAARDSLVELTVKVVDRRK